MNIDEAIQGAIAASWDRETIDAVIDMARRDKAAGVDRRGERWDLGELLGTPGARLKRRHRKALAAVYEAVLLAEACEQTRAELPEAGT